MWLRAEQLHKVKWAGDPNKPVELGNDPLTLSPRRSFATWTEEVRGTARPWTAAEHAMARAFGNALADITVQIHAVRLLIAEHQVQRIRGTVGDAGQPVLVADGGGRCLFVNDALRHMIGRADVDFNDLEGLAGLFEDVGTMHGMLSGLLGRYDPWRGTASLLRTSAPPLPVTVLAELVQGRGGVLLGFILTFTDLTERRRAMEARARLEAALGVDPVDRMDGAAGDPAAPTPAPAEGMRDADPVVRGIATHARLAALDIADGSSGQDVARLLDDLQTSTRRATALYRTIRGAAGRSTE
jgi:PAS domain-containing protein